MIPKRAIFCWSGPQMSWLRRQSIESFRRLNPEWDVMVSCQEGCWPEGDGFRFDVLRSDYARYMALSVHGGVYFDTDIIFVRPIPERWLDAPLFAPLVGRRVEHIACIGGVKDHPFWRFVADRCHHREATGVPLDCQAFGTKLLRRIAVPNEMASIPVDAFLTHPWDQVEYLWADLPVEIPPQVIGVHWYGGDRLSQDMEREFSEDKRPPCLVSKALSASLVVQ